MEPKIFLSILKFSTRQVGVLQISHDCEIHVNTLTKKLQELAAKHLIRLEKDWVTASPKQRLELAILAIKEGVDVERVCILLGWKEFEDLVALVLDYNEFVTQKHFRFKHQDRWFEIDVIGSKRPLLLAIDCKHWKKSWKKSATMRVVEKQLERTIALVDSFHKVKDRLAIVTRNEIRVLPLILTLSETPLKTYKKIPVVPIFYFQNFLNTEINSYLHEFQFYEVKDRV